MKNLVSIITPFYNAEGHLAEAILSVLNQSYELWELLLVDDGSNDDSLRIAKSFDDKRIRIYSKENGGVSSARNLALSKMQGNYFCFLDADDVLPKESIASRLGKFEENVALSFVDGVVTYVNHEMTPIDRQYIPSFKGRPLDRLVALDQRCLFGNTWMIKRRDNVIYHFDEVMTHAEDLYFYISVCRQDNGLYDYVKDEILYYRQTETNSMKNYSGLENGYRKLLDRIRDHKIGTWSQRLYLRFRITRIMVLTHLFDGRDFASSFRCCFKYWN